MPSNNKISVVTLLQAYRLLTNVITYQLFLLTFGQRCAQIAVHTSVMQLVAADAEQPFNCVFARLAVMVAVLLVGTAVFVVMLTVTMSLFGSVVLLIEIGTSSSAAQGIHRAVARTLGAVVPLIHFSFLLFFVILFWGKAFHSLNHFLNLLSAHIVHMKSSCAKTGLLIGNAGSLRQQTAEGLIFVPGKIQHRRRAAHAPIAFQRGTRNSQDGTADVRLKHGSRLAFLLKKLPPHSCDFSRE